MAVDLYAGIPVNDYAAALAWYERLLGSPPSFFPHDTEAVWELAEHRSVFIVQRPEQAITQQPLHLIKPFPVELPAFAPNCNGYTKLPTCHD